MLNSLSQTIWCKNITQIISHTYPKEMIKSAHLHTSNSKVVCHPSTKSGIHESCFLFKFNYYCVIIMHLQIHRYLLLNQSRIQSILPTSPLDFKRLRHLEQALLNNGCVLSFSSSNVLISKIESLFLNTFWRKLVGWCVSPARYWNNLLSFDTTCMRKPNNLRFIF